MTVSPWIVPTPYAHGYPTVLVLFLGALWEAAFACMLFFPLGVWDAESRIILGNVSRLFVLSLSILGHFFLLGMGLELIIKWARVVKFFGPTCVVEVHMCLGLKLIRHIWEASLPDVGLSKTVKAMNKSGLKRTIPTNWGLRLWNPPTDIYIYIYIFFF